MKNLTNISLLFLLTFISGIGLNSCTKDPEIIVNPKPLSQYLAEQIQFVNSELTFVRGIKVVGYNKNEYSVSLNAATATAFVTIKAAYLTALQSDSAILVSPTVTIPQVIAANQALSLPGKAFWAGINLCDKRPLNDEILAATLLNTSVIVGTMPGNVTAEAKTTFSNSIIAATKTRDASTTILDRQVNEAIDKLKAATVTFKAAIIK